jgi:hypothetical protein
MSGRFVKCAAAALCFAAFFATTPARALPSLDTMPAISLADTVRAWAASAWSALIAAVEENPGNDPNEGWLIDPNG